jgi:hypothetical protein
MTEISESRAANNGQPVADATMQMTRVNSKVLDFMFGAQKVLIEEIVFVGSETLDRAQTEAHLFTEFVSKMAGAHSVNGIKTMFEECGQHQIDFIRRDSERLFKHGERAIETAAKLFNSQPTS